MQSQPADVNYEMAFGIAGCPTGPGDAMLTDGGPLAVEDPHGNEEFPSTQEYPSRLGVAAIRDSISQGNSVPQLSSADLSLLQGVHAANAAAQAAETAAAAAAGAVSFAGRAMSSFGVARPPRASKTAPVATADAAEAAAASSAGAAAAAAEAAQISSPLPDVVDVEEPGQGVEL